MITGYDSGNQIVLEPNPHWTGTKPGFKRIVLRHIENTAALQANLLSGDIDMVAGEGVGLTIDQALSLQKAHPDEFHYEFKPSLTYEHVDLKKENPLLTDVRVREALLMAIDRQTMVDRLFQGKQPVAATWVNPLSPMFDPAVPVVKFDLAGAKALLKDAGWTPGADGVCRNAAGDRLSFELGTTAGNRLRELQEQVIQSNLKNACVEINIKNEPARTLFGETLKKRTFTGLDHVRLEQQRHRNAVPHPGQRADPHRRQQLRRRELPRLQRSQDGRRHRRRGRRAGPGQAEGQSGPTCR